MAENDEYYMLLAIEQAKIALSLGEVPVGAVIVWDDGQIIGTGYNCRENGKNALMHAELTAIDDACKKMHGWRLHRATLYVTLEPCPMCTGAIVSSRIKRVVYGAPDTNSGAVCSVMKIEDFPQSGRIETESDVLRDECAALLTNFFRQMREKKESKAVKESGRSL